MIGELRRKEGRKEREREREKKIGGVQIVFFPPHPTALYNWLF